MDLSLAVGDVLTPQQHGGSPRMGSVWNREVQRKSPDALTAVRKSLSNGFSTPAPEVNKRRTAAEFIKQCTGQDLPYSNDLNFRQGLRDGVLLCETLNKVVPHAVKIVTGPEAGNSNVRAFLSYISDTMQFPSEAKFSLQDLLSEDYDDRPRIVDCLLWLKKLHCGHDPSPSPFPYAALREPSDIRAVRDSPGKSDFSTALTQHGTKSQMAVLSAANTGRAVAAVPPSAAMAAICNDISRSLVSRLTPGVPAASTKYDTIISNVMEQFLNGLSVEYERRLLAKDQELNNSKEALARLNRELEALHKQLNNIAGEVAEQKRKEVEEQKRIELEASLQRTRDLEEELARTRQQLQEVMEALTESEAKLASFDSLQSEKEAAWQKRLEEAAASQQELSFLKQRCKELRDENCKLYNTVQDLKGSIRVYCRVRPLGTTGDTAPTCLDVGMDGELAIYDKSGERKVYKFDRVFSGDVTQQRVYEDVQPLIRSVMDGFNVCIFAYGQTGSGKTHTMTGSQEDVAEFRGINYRALDDLFTLGSQRSEDIDYTIKAQMLEIYNESIRDLLTEETGSSGKLDILSTQPSGQNVPAAKQVEVTNTADVLEMMRLGARNRHSAETKMNERSSRSHQVLTIIVTGTHRFNNSRTHACLHLIDLAGSERTDKSGVEGERLREANSINTSLSALGTVMHSLASKSKHVPFRNSKLTELLADSLSGQAKVCMLMHVAPENSSFGETVSTLNFGNRVASVTLGQAKCNVESGKVFEAHEAITKKDRQLSDLKEQLQASREREASAHRQMLEQASVIQNLRSQVAALQAESGQPPLTARSESLRTSTYGGQERQERADSAASTPASYSRGNKPPTPHNQTGQGSTPVRGATRVRTPTREAKAAEQPPPQQGQQQQVPVQTPRSQLVRNPTPPSLNAHSRSVPLVSVRSSGSLPPNGAQSADQPGVPPLPSAPQTDKHVPLNALRVNRGQNQATASLSSTATAGTKIVAPPARPLPVPRLDTAKASNVPSVPSGSMSARPSGRHTSSTAGIGSNSPSAFANAFQQASAAASKPAPQPQQRPSTSRSSSVYGGASGNAGMAATAAASDAKPVKAPMSSRHSGGWK
ncbi:hypothetical protein Agub_g15747 [Astrephomene gubernaculifera]|uniref:Uncharacterized protein n=1 Tax=Astrephomene gubernaculifera TaxID=47775 RepID=A0AAD3HU66_9CHLO|nr:hypothetical protein Agub_g15747 [Astrephomene gubernaculifera]